MSSSAAASTPTNSSCSHTNLPYLTTGLLQSAHGVNFSSFSQGFGAGLNNCAPLLDAQTSIANLHAPLLINFDIQLAEAAVRLAIGLFMGLKVVDAQKGSVSGCGSIEMEALKQKWCAVVYNLMELISGPSASAVLSDLNGLKTGTETASIAERLMTLMRSVRYENVLSSRRGLGNCCIIYTCYSF